MGTGGRSAGAWEEGGLCRGMGRRRAGQRDDKKVGMVEGWEEGERQGNGNKEGGAGGWEEEGRGRWNKKKEVRVEEWEKGVRGWSMGRKRAGLGEGGRREGGVGRGREMRRRRAGHGDGRKEGRVEGWEEEVQGRGMVGRWAW